MRILLVSLTFLLLSCSGWQRRSVSDRAHIALNATAHVLAGADAAVAAKMRIEHREPHTYSVADRYRPAVRAMSGLRLSLMGAEDVIDHPSCVAYVMVGALKEKLRLLMEILVDLRVDVPPGAIEATGMLLDLGREFLPYCGDANASAG